MADYRDRIRKLRAMTVENGCTPAEALNAAELASDLEAKSGPPPFPRAPFPYPPLGGKKLTDQIVMVDGHPMQIRVQRAKVRHFYTETFTYATHEGTEEIEE